MHSFRLRGIDPAPYAPLFALSDAQLQARGIVRRIASAPHGFPCRVSLEDAAVGDELLLLQHEHHAVASPYRASGAVYVRRDVTPAALPPNHVPQYVTRRLMSVRGYDAGHMMTAADVVEGVDVAAALQRVFADDAVAYVQLHNARQGCFSCHVDRVVG